MVRSRPQNHTSSKNADPLSAMRRNGGTWHLLSLLPDAFELRFPVASPFFFRLDVLGYLCHQMGSQRRVILFADLAGLEIKVKVSQGR